jgi:hypothetical protein
MMSMMAYRTLRTIIRIESQESGGGDVAEGVEVVDVVATGTTFEHGF